MKTRVALIVELDHGDCPQCREDECVEDFAANDLPAIAALIDAHNNLRFIDCERVRL